MMRRGIFHSSLFCFLLLVFVLSPAASVAQSAPAVNMPTGGNQELVVNSQPLRWAEQIQLPAAVTLGQASVAAAEQISAIAAHNAVAGNIPKNGFVRPVQVPVTLTSAGSLVGVARTVAVGGSELWTTRIRIEGAWRSRLHLSDVALPEGTQLWIYSSTGESVQFQVGEAFRPGATIDWWTPSVAGEDVRLEVQLPPGVATEDVHLTIDLVMQIFPLSPTGEPLVAVTERADTSCLQDATCFGTPQFPGYDFAKRAIAHIQYAKGSSNFICTGGLINDLDDTSTIPFFVTANHCIDNAASAASAEFFFDFRSSTCGGNWPNLGSLPRVNSSVIAGSAPNSDHTLLRLSGFPDNQRGLLGWNANANAAPPGTKLFRISHPMGFAQGYSETEVTGTGPRCSGLPDAQFFFEKKKVGGTFGGSSGAPVMTQNGAVVGQLFGVCGSELEEGCSTANNYVDGRFSKSFEQVGGVLQGGGSGNPCVPSATTMCIDNASGDRRFEVKISWSTANAGGIQGLGQVVSLKPVNITAGGLFWFFGSNNPEVLVKVLDACGINNHFWAFYSAGTDVAFSLVIRDTVTGVVWQRGNTDGVAAPPVSDFVAFPCN